MFIHEVQGISLKRVFLIDCLGAMLSAIMLGLVLPRFESLVGMPPAVLYILAFLSCLFAFYSFVCHLGILGRHGIHLSAIAVANLLYCSLTLALVGIFYQQLTFFGLAYFTAEIVVVVALAMMELRVARRYVE